MTISTKTVRLLSRARGVSLVTAIFLLVVLAGLGVAMVTITTAQQQGTAIDVQGTRAYQAARAGMEWALYKQLQYSQTSPPPAVWLCSSTTPVSFTLPAGTTLSSFTVTVTCTATTTPASTSSQSLARYHMIAVACNQPANNACPNTAPVGNDYVQRQVQAEY
jgi:MSHA biogenesis protein MshP